MEELLTITLEDKTTLEHIYKRRGKGNKEKDIWMKKIRIIKIIKMNGLNYSNEGNLN